MPDFEKGSEKEEEEEEETQKAARINYVKSNL